MSRTIRLLAATSMCIAPGIATAGGGTSVPPRVVMQEGQVRTIARGALTARPASNPPPAADLREVRLDRSGAGAYTAIVTFASSAWKPVTSFGGRPATHEVSLVLQPPSGPRLRVRRAADGVAVLEREAGSGAEKVGDVVTRVDGSAVVFEIPTSAGVTADWEIQAHTAVRTAAGTGVHAHSARVVAGSLSGEDARALRLPSAGTYHELDGTAVLWRDREQMPRGSRPTSVAMSRGTAGQLVVDVTMDGPPAAGSFLGRKATALVIMLRVGEPGEGQYRLLYDVIGKQVGGSVVGEQPALLDPTFVEVSGNVVRYRLPKDMAGTALGAVGGSIPVAAISRVVAVPEGYPAVDRETPVGVTAVLQTDQGGVSVETPIVPIGALLPPVPPAAPASKIPVVPIAGGVLAVGAIGAGVMMRRRSAASRRTMVAYRHPDGPEGRPKEREVVPPGHAVGTASPPQTAPSQPVPKQRVGDRPALEAEVLKARLALRTAEENLRWRTADEQAALAEMADEAHTVSGAGHSEVGILAPGEEAAPSVVDPTGQRVRRIKDAQERARAAERDVEMMRQELHSAEVRLKLFLEEG